MAVPLIDVKAHRARIGKQIDSKIADVVEHGLWIMGPEVSELEASLGEWVGSGVETVTCANGTDALTLAMTALGLRPGQAVVCPSFTFAATAETISTLGAHPVFADVAADGFNVSVASVGEAIEAARSEALEVVGVIAVDLFGHPADYGPLRQVCDEANVWLIADAAQSFGGSSGDQMVGALADITTTSFFPAKPLGCYGDGGAVFTAEAELASAVRSLRAHGKGQHKYDHERLGYNSRLDTIQAAVLLPKLAILDEEMELRQQVAETYNKGLVDTSLVTPRVKPDFRSAWAQYTVVTEQRDELQETLKGHGIGSAVYYPMPLHKQRAYARFSQPGLDLSVTEQLCGEVLSLPMYPYLTESMIDEVISVVAGALK